LKKKEQIVRIAYAHHRRSAEAKYKRRRRPAQMTCRSHQPANQQSTGHGVSISEREVGQPAHQRMRCEREQQCTGKTPFPSTTKEARTAVERQCRGHEGEHHGEIARREDPDHSCKIAIKIEKQLVRNRVGAPIRTEWRAQPAEGLGRKRHEFAVRHRLDPHQYLHRIADIVDRLAPAGQGEPVVMGAPDQCRDRSEQERHRP